MTDADTSERTPASVAPDGTIDFIAAWRAVMLYHADERIEADADRAFWEGYAQTYDERTAMPGSYDQTLNALSGLVRPTDSLLDIGAGTGRFALPLARCVQQVTALDYSPAMLAILRRKADDAGIANITVVEAALETMTVAPHDVVLAAWSLYRQVDVAAAVDALIRVTIRTLVIAASDASQAPHHPFLLDIWGRHGEPEHPIYLYLLGALRQLGYRAKFAGIVGETTYHRINGDRRCPIADTAGCIAKRHRTIYVAPAATPRRNRNRVGVLLRGSDLPACVASRRE